jgi:mercuric ion binding protein
MKKLFFTAIGFMAISFGIQAQSPVITDTLWVNGVCGMCEERIENAAYIPGVKKADWNVDTHQLVLIYKSDKTNLTEIQESIAAVGHDTRDIKATAEQYAQIHHCCKYRDHAPH